jgi:hypothetical protein
MTRAAPQRMVIFTEERGIVIHESSSIDTVYPQFESSPSFPLPFLIARRMKVLRGKSKLPQR